MWQFLLKVDPAQLASGELRVGASTPVVLATVVAIVILVGVVLGYARSHGAAGRTRDRLVLWALRAGALSLLFVLLLDPSLEVEVSEPVRGHVAVLLDDSLSMRIVDDDGRSRAERMLSAFAPGQGTLATRIAARFDTRFMRFAGDSEPLGAGSTLSFDGARSDVAAALTRVAERGDGSELASVVLVSDGAGADLRGQAQGLARAVSALEAAGVTLHVVGVGARGTSRDVELAEFVVPARVLRGDAVEATITIDQTGFSERDARVVVEDEGVIVAERTITFGTSDGRSVVRLPLEFPESGSRKLVARVSSFNDERIIENNARVALVHVRRAPIEVLHVEGEPRFEVKFLRRAVGGDDGIRLRSLVRTAENKFYRLGIDDAGELPDGLPADDGALFRYDAVVIGSVGDDLLDTVQQQRLNDFVARRGGGLVMLGGRHAFAEGGFAGTPVARLSPVVMPAEPSQFRRRVRIRPTRSGLRHPLLKVAPPHVLRATWTALPPLTMVNPIRRAKPGAVTLLNADDGSGEPLVGLAWHRYGRGTVAAFPVRDSWRWQMHADVPLDDMSHERLWRALLRHVARPALGRLRLQLSRGVAAVGDTVRVDAEVLDAAFRPRADAAPLLEVTSPSGSVERYRLSRDVDGASGYRTRFQVPQIGRYELRLGIEEDEGATRELRRAIEVTAIGDEYHGSHLDVAGLTRVAMRTGGRFFTLEEADALPGAIDDTRSVHTSRRQVRLADMPALLLALLLVLCLEWWWRRRCRLP